MAEAPGRPVRQARDRLGGLRIVEETTVVVTSDRSENLYVEDVWRDVIGVGGEPPTDLLIERTLGQRLEQA
jgi:hypothetical protein